MTKSLVGHLDDEYNDILESIIKDDIDPNAEIVRFGESEQILTELLENSSQYVVALIGDSFDNFEQTGIQVVKKLREQGVYVPVFIFGDSHNSNRRKEEACTAGASGYFKLSLREGFPNDEIITALKGCLGSP